VLGGLLAVFAGGSSHTEWHDSTAEFERPAPPLTPERAKEALLRLMQNNAEGELASWDHARWARVFDPVKWSKVGLEEEGFGWYRFGWAYRLSVDHAIFTLTVRTRFRRYKFEGSFVNRGGRWVATPETLRE